MRTPIVAGNWKMNGSKKSTTELLALLKQHTDECAGIGLIVFPPFVLLSQTEQLLSHTPIQWGAQNVSLYPNGAYTGEISAAMLVDFGCKYVLVGHSERRTLFHETNEEISEKYRVAQQSGLCPILCVGETLAEREEGRTFDVLEAQLAEILSSKESVQTLQNAVLAYEPVWAIGTGLTATPEVAQAVHEKIRTWVASVDKSIAEGLRILYGGSVKSGNAKTLFDMPDIDGGLIGGASLQAHEFLDIARSCNNS